MDKVNQIFLGLGSNRGESVPLLRQAVEALRPYMTITGVSPIYETAPAYVTDQPRFLNAVVGGTTALSPQMLLYTARDIERALGRTPVYKHGPRTMDIDILYFGALCQETTELIIPHRHVAERSFVLKPLAAIAPDFIDPLREQTIKELLDALPHTEDLVQSEETLL